MKDKDAALVSNTFAALDADGLRAVVARFCRGSRRPLARVSSTRSSITPREEDRAGPRQLVTRR